MRRFSVYISFLSFVFVQTTSLGQALADNPCSLPAGAQWPLDGNCYNVSTAGLSALFNPGSCNSGGFDDGWAWFYGDGNDIVITFDPGAAYDPILHVFSATVSPCTVTQIACSDYCCNNATEMVSITPSIIGQLYFIRIQDWGTNNTMTGCLSIESVPNLPPADYTHPSAGIANEYVGSCLVSTCNATYADDGDGTAFYSNSINSIYRVFCPDTPLNCVTVTFDYFNVEPSATCAFDYLTVGNGPTQNSTVFTTAPALASGRICGTPTVPFSYTSTHASGCLTMRFTSDAVVNAPGWHATITCTPCGGGPSGTDNSDCDFATGICSNTGNAGNSSGPGIVAEGCTGTSCPAGGENHTNWYSFTIATSGTLAFDIVPTTGTDDYDFAIYGPGVGCGTLGNPIRCSDAGTIGNTGMATGNFDLTEDVTGNGYVAPLNVTAGETYYMVVDEWTPTGAGYNLNFTGTASLDCTVLPIEMTEFTANYVPSDDVIDIYWVTSSEISNDYYTLEKSTDGKNYEIFQKVDGAGSTTNETHYYVIDPNPSPGTIYYRLKQTDFNGDSRYSKPTSVTILPESYVFSVFPNPTNGNFDIVYNCATTEQANLKVYDFSGRQVIDQEVDCSMGENRTTVNLEDFPEGIYMVVLSVNNEVFQTKLTKQN